MPKLQVLSEQDRAEIIAHARETMGDDELEFDPDARVNFSPEEDGGDNGAFVQAWVWVSFADTKWDQYQV